MLFETEAGDAISETGKMADQLERTEGAGKGRAKGVDASAAAAAKGSESFSGLVKGVGAARCLPRVESYSVHLSASGA